MTYAIKAFVLSSMMGVTGVTFAEEAVNKGSFAKNVNVKQALAMPDDSKVQLKGYVVKSVGDEKYQFRDATGSITVEIDDDLWNSKPVSAKTPVTIIGEVDVDDDKPNKRVEIDVDYVRF